MKKILSFLLAAVMCLSMFGTVFAAEMNFTDVKSSDWFYGDVKTAVEMGLVNGKSATTYAPNDKLTYAEAIKLAACMNQLFNEGSVTLTSGNPWYKPYVDYCIDNEIIVKEYNYTDNATRAGYMEIFANALPDEGLEAINNVPDNSIPDVPSSRAYAAGIYKLYRAGILTGVDAEHNCNPLANITRAEVAVILTRMMNEDKRVEITDMGEAEEEQKPEETTEPLAIKTQPVAVDVKVGETATVTVEAEGGKAPYVYQWRNTVTVAKTVTTILTDSSKISGAATDTLKITATEGGTTYNVSCKITDEEGNSVTSETVTIKFTDESSGGIKDKFQEVEKEELKNEDFEMPINQVVVVTNKGIVLVGRISEGKVNVGDTVYVNDADNVCIAKTTVKEIEMFNKSLDEVKRGDNAGILVDLDVDTYRSKIVEGNILSASEGSSAANKELAIVSQSKDMKGSVGLFNLNVEVEGGAAPYTYQWQRLVAITTTGKKTQRYMNLVDSDGTIKGAQTAKLIISITELETYKYKCVITDAEGKQVTTEVITITVDSESSGGRVAIPVGGKSGSIE